MRLIDVLCKSALHHIRWKREGTTDDAASREIVGLAAGLPRAISLQRRARATSSGCVCQGIFCELQQQIMLRLVLFGNRPYLSLRSIRTWIVCHYVHFLVRGSQPLVRDGSSPRAARAVQNSSCLCPYCGHATGNAHIRHDAAFSIEKGKVRWDVFRIRKVRVQLSV